MMGTLAHLITRFHPSRGRRESRRGVTWRAPSIHAMWLWGRAHAQYRLGKENDFLNPLERQWLTISWRLLEQHNDLRKGGLQFGNHAMCRSACRKLRPPTLDHTWVAPQTTDWQDLLAQIAQSPLDQGVTLRNLRLLNFAHRIGEHGDGMGKAQTVTVELHRMGRGEHQASHGIVSQQKPIELLLDPIRGLTAQGVLAQALVSIDLINGDLDFPAFVIGPDDLLCRDGTRVEQGGHQTMQFSMSHTPRIINTIFNDAYWQRSPSLMTRGVVGIEIGQVASITQLAHIGGDHVAGQSCHHMNAQTSQHGEKGRREEATIQQDQHSWLHPTQNLVRQRLLSMCIGSKGRIDNLMGSALLQIHPANLRKGSRSMLAMRTPIGQII